jgi:photosystem II stability/assembly factor-like uncharacterized protein
MNFNYILKVFLISLVSIVGYYSATAQWIQSDYGVFEGTFSSITIQGENVIAGTYSGGIYRSTDKGLSWKQSNAGLSHYEIVSLTTSGNQIFASTLSGLYVSSNGGQSWSPSGLSNTFIDVLTSHGNVLLAAHFGIYKSTDNGVNWILSAPGEIIGTISAIASVGQNLIAGNGSGDLFLSPDDGSTWTKITSIPGIIYSLVSNGNAVFCSTNLGLYRSLDGGVTWYSFNSNISNVYRFVNFNNTLIAASGKEIFVTNDPYGAEWITANISSNISTIVQLATDGIDLYAATYGYGIVFSSDGGFFWDNRSEGLIKGNVNALVSLGSTVVAGGNSGIFRSTDQGNTWSATNFLPSPNYYVTMLATLGNTFYATTVGAGIFRSDDNGLTWSASNTGLSTLLVYSITTQANHIYLGTDNGVFVSTDYGLTWASAGLQGNYINNILVKDKTLFATTIYTGLFRSFNEGNSWNSIRDKIPDANITSLATLNGKVYAGAGSGLYVSVDEGETWSAPTSVLLNKSIREVVANGNNLFISIANSWEVYIYSGSSVQHYQQISYSNADVTSLTAAENVLVAAVNAYNGSGSIWTTPIQTFPNIDTFSPQKGKVGSFVRIVGNNFSPIPEENIVQFGGVYAKVINATSTTLIVEIPGTAGNIPIEIQVNGKATISSTPFIIQPEIKSFFPTSGIAGTLVTLRGYGFIAHDVKFNGVSAPTYLKSSLEVVAAVPEGATTGLITLESEGQTISTSVPFRILPNIVSFSPTSGKVGTEVYLFGSGFSPIPTNNQVDFNGVPAQIILGNTNSLLVVVPPNAKSGLISISTDGNTMQSANPFTLLPLPLKCFIIPPKPIIIELPGSILSSNVQSGNQWFLNGVTLPEGVNPILQISKSGNYSVQVTHDGCVSPLSDPYPFIITGDISDAGNYSIYPNPAIDYLQIILPETADRNVVDFLIYNSLGQIVSESKLLNNEYLNIADLIPGIYSLVITSPEANKHFRFVKE